MKAVVQRVSRASCTVEGPGGEVGGGHGRVISGQIGPGLLVLLGVAPADTPDTAAALADRLVKLRVFSDGAGRMNRSLLDTGGAVLSVSQFTLFADLSRGNRPSFLGAAPPDQGRALYAAFGERLREQGVPVQQGVFGAHMQIELVNDGPVTLLLDTER